MAIRRLRANLAPSHRKESSDYPRATSKSGSSTAKRPRRTARRLLAVACLGLLVADTGCTIVTGSIKAVRDTECLDEFMTNYRNRAMAEKAWHCRRDRFPNDQYERDFKQGFIDGYLEIAEGGPGCCPSIAPSRYWGWQYQSAHGQQAINAWFAGYPFGVVAAEEEGVGNWNQVVTLSGTNRDGKRTGGAGCNNCGPTGTAPAKPMQDGSGEMMPTPLPEMQMDGGDVEMIIPPAGDAVTPPLGQLGNPTGSSAIIARRELTGDTGLIDMQATEMEFTAPTGPAASELKLTPSQSTSTPLPFSFE